MEQVTAGRPEAAEAIWAWQAGPAAPERRRTGAGRRGARRRGAVRGAVSGSIAVLVYVFLWPSLGLAIGVFAAILFGAAMISPGVLYAGIERLFAWTSEWIRRAVTVVSMVSLFYGAFVPFGRVLRRGRRDRLKRYFDAGAESYWVPHDPERSARSRRRLF